jgi:conjugal transfer pilus assembly protein TraB
MTDAANTPSTAPAGREASPSELSGLNARTARRQKLLLGSLGSTRAGRRQLVHPWRRRQGEERRSQCGADDRHGGLVNRDLSAARVRRDLRQPGSMPSPRAEGAEGWPASRARSSSSSWPRSRPRTRPCGSTARPRSMPSRPRMPSLKTRLAARPRAAAAPAAATGLWPAGGRLRRAAKRPVPGRTGASAVRHARAWRRSS